MDSENKRKQWRKDSAAWRERNPIRWKDTRQKYRARLASIGKEAKDKPCLDCGIKYPTYIMQFDHVRGEKIAEVSLMYKGQYGERRLREEIAKCDVVCANCHAERTNSRL